jgi:multiple sugar transport system substrate-binding protein
MSEPKKVGRRTFLNYAIAVVATGVIVGAATYLAVPKGEVTVTAPGTTVTKTVTTTVTGTPTTITTPSAPPSALTVNVIAQDTPVWDIEEKYLDEFYKETGVRVKITYYAEDDRRAKELLDGSTHAGAYQVYYIDEANVATFAANGWILPLLDYFPSDYDFNDFRDGFVNTLSYKGIRYGAPMYGESDMTFYRTDLFEAKKIALPITLDDFLDAAKQLANPPSLYGCGTRGSRGSGANVWRWSPYLVRFGGTYLDSSGEPVFNSQEAIDATAYYIELIKLSPSPTMLWSDVLNQFQAGKEALIEDADGFYDFFADKSKSVVYDKFSVCLPCKNKDTNINVSAICAHGLAISTYGCPTPELREAAGRFIAWFTSKQNEIRRVEGGYGISTARKSTLASKEMTGKYPPAYVKTAQDCIPIQKLCIPQIPEWPQIGDYLGINLEKLFTAAFAGQKVSKEDIKAALDDAVAYAKKTLAKK